MSDRFDELVGEIADQGERDRLRRVHELLLSVDPPPELSTASLEDRRGRAGRRRGRVLALLAAALRRAAFGAGWLGGARATTPNPSA